MNTAPKTSPNQNKAKTSPAAWWIRHLSYWIKLIVQPFLAVAFVILLAWLFGYLQRNQNWFNDAATSSEASEKKNAQYACSMLCVFVAAPGRCPVCGMELQEIESTGDPKDLYGLTIEPAARRLANIETVSALPQAIGKTIEVLGRVEYDETRVSVVSAYVPGRIEELFIDYTGATIRSSDALAVLYSPDLHIDQVGLLQAKTSALSASGDLRVEAANQRLYQSSRQRLIERGLTESQLEEIEMTGKPTSRLKLFAPTDGTVVEKLVSAGQYVKTGMPILKIADLSTVWLMLELYPNDAASLRLGQTATVEFQSQVGRTFEGRISFIDPNVTAASRTVPVRVEIPNDAGLLKIGELGKAMIRSSSTTDDSHVLIPRSAVLMNGSNSVAYIETDPGRFEFRRVQVAEVLGNQVSISAGIQPGEQVVASGTFMLDSTFNIQGKASLIDSKKAPPALPLSSAINDQNPSNEDLPQMKPPEMDLPRMELPQMDLPQMDLPQMDLPQMDLPQMDLPQMDSPQMEVLDTGNPPVGVPKMKMPEVDAPRMELPELDSKTSAETEADLPRMDLPSMEAIE